MTTSWGNLRGSKYCPQPTLRMWYVHACSSEVLQTSQSVPSFTKCSISPAFYRSTLFLGKTLITGITWHIHTMTDRIVTMRRLTRIRKGKVIRFISIFFCRCYSKPGVLSGTHGVWLLTCKNRSHLWYNQMSCVEDDIARENVGTLPRESLSELFMRSSERADYTIRSP